MSFLPKVLPRNIEQRREDIRSRILRREAKIGGNLFGPIPKGRQREFFCLDKHNWIWFEAWRDKGQNHAVTTRYEVRQGGILKSQNGQGYQYLSSTELRNFSEAINAYNLHVSRDLQSLLQAA